MSNHNNITQITKSATPTKPELLAPAGSVESFHAAIEAGGDAIYLGINGGFNARLRAKNFAVKDLQTLIPHAHSRGVKVYITLNTIVKQSEIKRVLDIVYQLDQISADALIVADVGLIKLISTHFPKMRIHASTQAAIHNSAGLAFMKSLGVKRVVLARELSVEEICGAVKKSEIETEVFVHGALCYCVSGLCLASSFIGGASGNRGKCTQLCRRKFLEVSKNKNANTGGYFFSPHDLQAAEFLQKLVGAGVSSFKIEGRMKGAEYVYTVVKSYREIVDNIGDTHIINDAVENLRYDFGREKTTYYLDGMKSEVPIDATRPTGTGILIGKIIAIKDSTFTLSTQVDNIDMMIARGDRLRVQPQNGFEGVSCKLVNCVVVSNDNIDITVNAPVECAVGDFVFLIGKADVSQKSVPIIKSSAINIKTNFPNAQKIANSLNPPLINETTKSNNVNGQKVNNRIILWAKIDRVEWLDYLTASPCRQLIFDADVLEIEKLFEDKEKLNVWRSRIFVALPVFINENAICVWRKVVDKCKAVGINSFAVSNVSHFSIIQPDKKTKIVVDNSIACVNRFTQKEFITRGACNFVYSYEDEYLNIRDAANGVGIVSAYGLPPLFISRMPPAVECGAVVVDPHKNKFVVHKKNGLYYTVSKTPVCLFAKLDKLEKVGIFNFMIDLCFCEYDINYDTINKIIAAFKERKKIEGASIFNFKAGLF